MKSKISLAFFCTALISILRLEKKVDHPVRTDPTRLSFQSNLNTQPVSSQCTNNWQFQLYRVNISLKLGTP